MDQLRESIFLTSIYTVENIATDCCSVDSVGCDRVCVAGWNGRKGKKDGVYIQTSYSLTQDEQSCLGKATLLCLQPARTCI